MTYIGPTRNEGPTKVKNEEKGLQKINCIELSNLKKFWLRKLKKCLEAMRALIRPCK